MERKLKTILIAASTAVVVGIIIIAMLLTTRSSSAAFKNPVEKIPVEEDEVVAGGNGVTAEAAAEAETAAEAESAAKAKELYENIIAHPLTVVISSSNNITDTISTDTLEDWVSVSGTEVTVDPAKVSDYVQGIANQYNSWGQQISFTTHSGNTISLGAVDYGWRLNQDTTTADLQAAILSGNADTVSVTWASKETVMGTNGVGNTYIEADLDAQHVYVYKNGAVVLSSDVVSGRAANNWGTPNGVFEIVGMQRDATLKGENYSTPVSYWMPFYLGWGFHDASWRSAFGGKIYVASGSHGCINLPPSFAKELFDTIYVGMPVIVYGGMSQSEAQTYLGSRNETDEADAADSSTSGENASAEASTGSDAEMLTAAKAVASALGISADDQQISIIAQAIANYEAVGMTAEQAQAQVQSDLQAQAAAARQQASDANTQPAGTDASAGQTAGTAADQNGAQAQAAGGTAASAAPADAGAAAQTQGSAADPNAAQAAQ